MTRITNARLAGFTFLFYIATGIPAMILFGRATSGEGTAAKLVSIGQHATDLRVAIVLSLLGCFSALVLAVTLYGITRDEDNELAMLGLACRVGEKVIGAASFREPALLWLGTPVAWGLASGACSSALATWSVSTDSPRSRRPKEWMWRSLPAVSNSPRRPMS